MIHHIKEPAAARAMCGAEMQPIRTWRVTCDRCLAVQVERRKRAALLASEAARRAAASTGATLEQIAAESPRGAVLDGIAPSHMEWLIESFGESLRPSTAVMLAARSAGRSWNEIGRWAGISGSSAKLRATGAFVRMMRSAAIAERWPRPRMTLVEER